MNKFCLNQMEIPIMQTKKVAFPPQWKHPYQQDLYTGIDCGVHHKLQNLTLTANVALLSCKNQHE